ncbi:MAG: GntR family transcriptional regulator [Sphingomonadales bacterium]|nr:GntR family transcriptional regulator [Sphingomonadales bacterium]
MAPVHLLQRSPSLADQAADHIRRRIIDGDLRLGQALSESDLAGQLGVSKTPVREAFLRLKIEGLVDIQPQRGTFVFSMRPPEIEKLVSVRTMLETSALQSAIGRDAAGLGRALAEVTVSMKAAVMAQDDEKYRLLDGTFHGLIIKFSDNSFLASCYDSIDFRVRALRNRLADRPGLNARTLNEHRALAALIAARRLGKAKALLNKHLGAAMSDYDQFVRDHTAKLQ